MEKKILLMKSLLQTCYFSLKMQKNIAILTATIMLYAVYDFLFFHPHYILYNFGMNVLIMSVLTILTVIVVHQPAINNRNFWWASFGMFVSAINLTYYNDTWAHVMFFVSYFLLVGHLHGQKFKNLLTGFLQWFIINVCSPISFLVYLHGLDYWDQIKWKKVNRILNIIIIPLLLIILFIGLYSLANTSFRSIFIDPFVNYFSGWSPNISWDRIGLLITASIMILPLMTPIPKVLKIKTKGLKRHVIRTRKLPSVKFKNLDLSAELKVATLSFIGLNILVFIFNTLDIYNVWFSISERSAQELSNYVHDGTNMIITSIVIGAGLILLFFRKNLNFHPKNIWLKRLSYLWLAQNAFLALSVIQRNAHYVAEYGLTEKRLGLLIFIILCLVGLYFCYLKIAKKQSLFHFFNNLCLSFFLICLGYSIVDHERLIIHHAIYIQENNVDLKYLRNVGYNDIDLLMKHQDRLEAKSIYRMEISEYEYNRSKSGDWRKWNFKNWKHSKKNNHYLSVYSK